MAGPSGLFDGAAIAARGRAHQPSLAKREKAAAPKREVRSVAASYGSASHLIAA
jgi:hypothetical protein